MEGETGLSQEKFRKSETPTEELLHQNISANNYTMEDHEDLKSLKSKSSAEMLTEREKLQTQLDELKKENFSIRASVNAWQHLLEDQLDEFIETDLELNKIYDEIWAEREKFCFKADQFNEEFGVLSAWWQKQMKFVTELESLEKRTLEGKKCREEIKKLEKEVTNLGRKIKKPEEENNQHVVEVDVHAAQNSDVLRNAEPKKDLPPKDPDKLSHELSQIDEAIEVYEDQLESPKNELFSMVDVETVRKVNRKHRRFKSSFFTGLKKSIFKQ